MKHWAIILVVLLAGCDSRPDVVFANAAIILPDDPAELPPGPGLQAVVENCTACHSPSTMLQQPQVPRAKWESIVGKMIETYKAPVDEKAIPDIVDYFVAVQAAQVANPGGSAVGQ